MTEYITKDQVLKIIDNVEVDTSYWAITIDGYVIPKPDTFERLRMEINNLPPADVVEVVRCKDCKNLYPDDTGKLHWCDCHRMFVGLDDFCNYGKRKDGGENK